MDICSRDFWDEVVSTEEVVDSGEHVVWVGVKSKVPVYRVQKLPNVSEVKGVHSGCEKRGIRFGRFLRSFG